MTPGGPVIAGYEAFQPIGRGGHATVYRARQLAFAREVAVKVIDRQHPDQQTLDQFRRECEAVGSLSWHPHVVSVFDAGETADGHPYLTMELLPGGSLDDALRGGPLPVDQAISFGHQIADAVASAHEVGVLHRDLKPANVLVDRRGEARLADFGIARMMGTATTVGGVSGTIAYMAPELLMGERASPASDIYGIGMTVAAMILGRSPLDPGDVESPWAMVQRVGHEPLPDLRPLGAPEGLASLVESCTAKDPADRPASASDVHVALGAGTATSTGPTPGPDGAGPAPGPDRAGPGTDRPDPAEPTVSVGPPLPLPGPAPGRRPAGLKLVALVASLVLFAVGVAVVWSRRGPDDVRTSGSTASTVAGPVAPTDAGDAGSSDTSGDGPSQGAGDDSSTGGGAGRADGVPFITPGFLTMCTEMPYAPFTYWDAEGEKSGFDVELVRAIAIAADLELEVRDVGLGNGTLDAPGRGRCDLAGPALTITPDRAKEVDFTRPYLDTDLSLLVPAASGFSTLADLKASAEPVVGVVTGTTGERYATDAVDVRIADYPSAEAVLDALETGAVSGVIQDSAANTYRAAQDPTFKVIETYPTDEQYGFAVEKGNTRMVEFLDAGLEDARDDGTYDDLYRTYFGSTPGG